MSYSNSTISLTNDKLTNLGLSTFHTSPQPSDFSSLDSPASRRWQFIEPNYHSFRKITETYQLDYDGCEYEYEDRYGRKKKVFIDDPFFPQEIIKQVRVEERVSPIYATDGVNIYNVLDDFTTYKVGDVRHPSVTFYPGASLLTVKRGRETPIAIGFGGLRTEITKFSKSSRRRLQRLIAMTDREIRPLFCHLTYPDFFPDRSEVWKRDLDVFGKRFRRKFPDGAFIWKMEFQQRKSGVNKGQIAPHFHLLVWGVDYYEALNWFSQAWYEVVQSGDVRHLGAGTRVEEIRSFRGVMSYTSKYMSKLETAESVSGKPGRFWGAIGRANLPLCEEVNEELTEKEAVTLIRYMRRFAEMPEGFDRKALTIFCDANQWSKVIYSVKIPPSDDPLANKISF